MIKSIKKNWEFKKVYNQGKYIVSPYTVLYLLPNKEGEKRLGITVSKKVGNSVERHRIKRIYKEIFRLNHNKIIDGYDMVLVARKKAAELNFKLGCKDVIGLLKKGKLLEKTYKNEIN
ncbi:ribonuclease P protein component [Candidatus Contubernalis alkaliaceticus]|uniref:ribonuclease P protein component n=1 Tax=Candidatus Contubernalis alkaliaceticus TaxID=338645 RepID=UPI001F4BF2D0|nr:ribonuclease P protein component [Candidatus Contubernalis alkalaceticus]UNC93732.1 ribonuclease P protein component [Candidatus Contubernalis alkalaceticus]